MELFKKITGNIVFGFQVLIVFLLLFGDNIVLPPLLQSLGRTHPLILHIPIGLMVIAALLMFLERHFGEGAQDVVSLLLYLLALTSSFTALAGLFLSVEGGYDEQALLFHKWGGVATSFLAWALISGVSFRILKPVLAAALVVLIFTGHYGATLTHGEDFVSAPLLVPEKKTRVITDSSAVFDAAVDIVLEAKCYGCHNESKAKGRLVLTSLDRALRGGKNGKLWKPGDAAHSLIVERITLPLDEKEHMPPKDKAQLSAAEIDLFRRWIDAGADPALKLTALAEHDSLRIVARQVMTAYTSDAPAAPIYSFASISNDRVQSLNTPHRTVFRIAAQENALGVNFYLRESFSDKSLSELKPVSDRIVSLNLSKMDADDSHLKIIASFVNLEKLVLNYTNITGSGFDELSSLRKLRSLSLSGTKVTAKYAGRLGELPALKEVAVWNTSLSASDIDTLARMFPRIQWNAGYQPDDSEKLKLNPPLVANESVVLTTGDGIRLRHNLPGAEIRFTLDGSKPDSTKGQRYSQPVVIDRYSVVKARAFRDGWLSSDAAEYVFYVKGKKPVDAVLESKPEPKHEGLGALTLIDEVKGMPDFYKDPSWVGFRNQAMIAWIDMPGDAEVTTVTLSYARNVWAMCMPPAVFEVWGGPARNNMRLLGKAVPEQPRDWVPNRIEGVSVSIPPSRYPYYKLVARPLAKLPEFRNAKKEKGWLMVDEVFFN